MEISLEVEFYSQTSKKEKNLKLALKILKHFKILVKSHGKMKTPTMASQFHGEK